MSGQKIIPQGHKLRNIFLILGLVIFISDVIAIKLIRYKI